MRKNKFLLPIFLLVFTSTSNAQMYEDEMVRGIAIRGKAFGFFIFEDYWVLNFTGGFEYRFHKNFAIGTDFVHVNNIIEQEQYNDSTRPDYYVEYSKKNPRSCFLGDFRIYPFRSFFTNKQLKPYINIYTKLGNAHWTSQPEYRFTEGEVYRQSEIFSEFGSTIGAHLAFGSGKGGLDVNMGYGKRFITENVEYFSLNGPNTFFSDRKRMENKLACRVNLYFYLWTKELKY